MSKTTLLIGILAASVLITDISLLAVYLQNKGEQTQIEKQQEEMDGNLQEMFDTYGTSSFFGTDSEDRKEYLESKNDLYCDEEGVCCGGNSIGFYTCFYPDDTK